MIGRGKKGLLLNRNGSFFLGCMLVWAVSCTGMMQSSRTEEPSPEVQEEQRTVSFSEVEFRFAMTKLENGDYEGSRETLTEIAEREEEGDLAPKVAFALGVLHLLEMEDVGRMKEARDYFQAFSKEYPDGPYRETTDRIVLLLEKHIQRAKQQQKRIRQLTKQASDQEQVIQTLKYKIEKLEEIHRETEQKRHLLEGE
jgi:outer membrane protein assembly factor BamD (BamD/ComL family)